MFGASAFQLRWDGQNIISNATAIGWGVSFSGREYFGKNHYFFWMGSYGQGWGSQIVSTLGTSSSAILTTDGNLEIMPAWNLGAGIEINILPTLATNINGFYYAIDPSTYRDADKMKSGTSAHINLIWSPINNASTGIEYMVLQRVNGNGDYGVGRRLQLMLKYVF